MRLPMIKRVSVANQPEKEGVLAQVSFGEGLYPAQEKYLKTVFEKFCTSLDIKLAMDISGRGIVFYRFGKKPIPGTEILQQLLDGMDIGTVDPTPAPPQMSTKRGPTGKISPSPDTLPGHRRRQAVVPVFRSPFVPTAA